MAAEEARRSSEEEERELLLADAAESQRGWRCPRAGCDGDPTKLDEAHTKALARLERLTGHRFKTCPRAGLWEGWVHQAVEAESMGLGEVRLVYGRVPAPLVEAVRIVRRARLARSKEEDRVREENRQRKPPHK